MTRFMLFAPILALLFILPGCASLTVKQRAVSALQASETALEAAHDFERALCFNNPTAEQGGHCTNLIAATVGLTDARHQGAATLFAQAFSLEIKAATTMKTWQTNGTVPPTLITYQQELTNLLTLAQQLDPQASQFLGYVQAAVNSAAAIAALVGA